MGAGPALVMWIVHPVGLAVVLITFPSPTPVTHAQTSTIDLAHLFHGKTSGTVRQQREREREMQVCREGCLAGEAGLLPGVTAATRDSFVTPLLLWDLRLHNNLPAFLKHNLNGLCGLIAGPLMPNTMLCHDGSLNSAGAGEPVYEL